MDVFTAVVVGLVFLILNLQPASRVVLLPDADGKTGAVIVKSESSQKELVSAYSSAGVGRGGEIALQPGDATQVLQRYGETLVARPQAPVSFVLYFEFGSGVDIAPAFKPVLEQLLATLTSYPAPEITVIGHTDRVGSLEFNDQLSLQRAQTVRDLILQAGIAAATIEVAGRGEREPQVFTADEVPEEKNRRVEINLR